MKIYNVGKDVPYDLPSEDDSTYVWLVFDYEDGGYDGQGTAVALGVDGLIYVKDLSHCSCYGPFDGFGYGKWSPGVTIMEYMRPKDSVHDMDIVDVIHQKVVKLLNEN